MALSGNKGEWSEIYTLFRLLGEGKIHAGDAHMNKLDIYYPILNVIRNESKTYEYKPDVSKNIVVIDENGNEFLRIPMDSFMKESETLLDEIKKAKKSAFTIPDTEGFMNTIGCTKLKPTGIGKSDIHVVIHDMRTNMTPLLGFSIKSQLGKPATLLNAGNPTNILYKVVGDTLSDDKIAEINSIEEHLPRMKALKSLGCSLQYHDIEHETFKNNLCFLDCYMPRFIADCLSAYSFDEVNSSIKECVENVAFKNPMGYTGNINSFYEHKMKVLLCDTALGMTPAKEWEGRYDANGGYIVVKTDGELVCYHFYNKNDVEDYLYHNTRFERASRSRHNFGSLFRGDDGEVYIRLNLQIRFKK